MSTSFISPIIRLAQNPDIPALQAIDPWPNEEMLQQKIQNKEVIVLELDNKIIGLIRYAVLWATVPFMGLIIINIEHHKKGYSRQLLDFLKEHLRNQSYVALLSSSQTDEPEPQAWHVYMGFTTNGIIENIADDNIGEIVYRLML